MPPLPQPQDTLSLEDEHRLGVGEVEMHGERFLPGGDLDPARADAFSAVRCRQPLAAEGESAVLLRLLLTLHQRGLVHGFFPSCTRGFCPRGTAVMFAIATRSATFWAIFVNACASGSPGAAATTGRPSSLPARMAELIGPRPRKGTPSLHAACSAPPLDHMYFSWWQFGQMKPLMFSTNPSTGM